MAGTLFKLCTYSHALNQFTTFPQKLIWRIGSDVRMDAADAFGGGNNSERQRSLTHAVAHVHKFK